MDFHGEFFDLMIRIGKQSTCWAFFLINQKAGQEKYSIQFTQCIIMRIYYVCTIWEIYYLHTHTQSNSYK